MSVKNPADGVLLIVDDTPTNLKMLCDFLTNSGFEVLVAVDGESAIEQTVYAQPNLILLDVLMPGIDGFETCSRLKANPSTQAIPVIFMTALGETVDKVRGFQVGAVDYVTKPLQPEEVLARITNHLTIQNLQNQLQEQNLRLQQEVKERQQAEDLVRQQAQREQLLGEMQGRIRQSLDLEEILSTTVSEVRQFLQTDRVLIYRFFDDWSGVVAVESVSTDELSILNTTISDPCFGEAYVERYQQGRIMVIEDIYTAGMTPCHVDFLASIQVRANLVVPILQKERLWGLLVAHHCYEPRQWQQWEVDFLEALSTQIAIAIQQGQLHQRLYSIVENAIEGIFQTTPSGRFISGNPALARIFGYSSPEELIRSIQDIGRQIYVDSNRRDEFIAAIQTDNAVFDFESQIYRKDGSVIWVSENTRAVRDSKGALLYYEGAVSDITVRKVAQESLRFQQEQAEQLLLNILPESIAQQLKRYPSTIADNFEAVSVLFADIVGFTEFSARTSPTELVIVLNLIFSKFDQLAERHGLEKIKTIGDAYMVVAGLPTPRPDHAIAIAEMALDMQSEMVRVGEQTGEAFKLRIGINSGPVIAGVIGIKKFFYDLWGDTVNVASRMESQGVDGAIQVTAATYELLRDKYLFEERGVISVKGKGDMTTYLLTGRSFDDSLLSCNK
ncbi:adenylate/guanylate cyclase domain-containing protein [Allocoleopsis franciscana]|uniref:Adenylate cyclase n=1 Tax=Allocoleopsis franciscana PCC 7113 TaxID=1173027 RepID=K9WE29_9CYAN|nr:adenylate/guanylate cyclase domain-containing protein [Allocoleopsis franciscana]AFZ18019.1 PAS domain S-box [Allocoleopsis franciscana PCC 7113]